MNSLLAKYLLYSITSLRRQPLVSSLRFLEMSQWWDSAKIKKYQEQKLKKLLLHSYENVEYYRAWFEDNRIMPDEIGLKDIHLLPVVDKAFLRDNLEILTAKKAPGPAEHAKTSGSTGVPLHFPKSLTASAMQLAALYRGHRWHGVQPGDKEARLWGIPVNRTTRIKTKFTDFLLNRFREEKYNLNYDVMEKFFNSIKKHRPAYLMGYTSMVREFAHYLDHNNMDARQCNLKMVKCTSETINNTDYSLIEKVFGCKLVSEYGAAETGLIAFECEKGKHHIMADCCIVEFIEPEEDIGDSDLKELIVTNLDNYALPVIRYRIGDLARPANSSCCCGRGLPLLEKIVGRSSNVIKASNGSRWHSIMLYYIMKGLEEKYGGIAQFKVYQKKLDHLEVHLVPKETFSHKAEEYLRQEFKRQFGGSMRLDFKVVDSIPREPSGKLRDFVSMIK